tara:strand:+ start:509 stop:733 length:225 start_codon:yes stop_codon:yes gene_type:complete
MWWEQMEHLQFHVQKQKILTDAYSFCCRKYRPIKQPTYKEKGLILGIRGIGESGIPAKLFFADSCDNMIELQED